MIWNREDAEEIVQEAFKLAATAGPKLPHERYVPWMFRTVGNLCRNHRRRRKPEPLAEWTEVSQGESPDDQLQRVERLEALRTAIARLPDQQRTALILRTMEQMDYLDIAEIMVLSVAAVRSHVHFARRRLAEMLGQTDSEARP
jgi:RNA polymerase sigma-70 factor (ECF subfamily)